MNKKITILKKEGKKAMCRCDHAKGTQPSHPDGI